MACRCLLRDALQANGLVLFMHRGCTTNLLLNSGDACEFATSSAWFFAELSVGGFYRFECFSPCVIRLLRVLEMLTQD